MCWACMQCKLTYKQKHTNYKKLTKFRLYNRNCTIVHKLSINVVTQSGQTDVLLSLAATNIQAISLKSRLPASSLYTFKSRTLFNRSSVILDLSSWHKHVA